MERRIALTGPDGLIGSAVLDELVAARCSIAALSRRPLSRPTTQVANVVATAGLGDESALRHLTEGADTLIHAASYVGPDLGRQREVNIDGTLRVVSEAQRQGVDRIVYVSTATVYGAFARNAAPEGDLQIRPSTPLSASRARAEEIVLEAGGTVLRPHLVYGEGDRWFLGRYVAMTHALGAWVTGGEARLSVIDRADLGRLVASIAEQSHPVDRVLHACYPDPVRIETLAAQVFRQAGLVSPTESIPRDDAVSLLRPLGIPESLVNLVAGDNWLDSDRIWEMTGLSPRRGSELRRSTLDWYARNARAVNDAWSRLLCRSLEQHLISRVPRH